jgi:tetratricopeptide (TPR) repeat protein
MVKATFPFARNGASPRRPQTVPVSGKVNPKALVAAAREHFERGETRQAEKLCLAVLTRDPFNPEALLLASSLAQEAGDAALAVGFLRRACDVQPNSVGTRVALASALEEIREFDEAIPHYRRCLALRPNTSSAVIGLARSYVGVGKAELALPFFEQAMRLEPSFPPLRLKYANALTGLGRMDEAAVLLRDSIARGFEVASCYRLLADSRKFSTEPDELAAMLRLLQDPDVPPADAMRLHHAAGKIMNDLGRYDQAVDHFQASKTVSGYDFDIADFRRQVDTFIAAFTPQLMRSKAGIGDPSDVPVFIVGMPRSGTTLTEQICASHPLVYGAGELVKLGRVVKAGGYAAKVSGAILKHPQAMTRAEAQAMASDYLGFLRSLAPEASRVIDKMPHNFLFVGIIALLFPNARIIHCTRDAIDNCLSCFFHTFNDRHGYNAELGKLGLYYREYHRLMRHWTELLPGRIYESRYETMVADQEAETRRLIDFLGLPWDDACLRFYETDRAVTTPSRWEVRQPIYDSSVKRWKKYENKIQPLIEALGDLAEV